MKTIMARSAINSVALVTTSWATTRVTKMETKLAWKAGWVKIANKVPQFSVLDRVHHSDIYMLLSLYDTLPPMPPGTQMCSRICSQVYISRTLS